MADWSRSNPIPPGPGQPAHSVRNAASAVLSEQAPVVEPVVPSRDPIDTSRERTTVATIGPSLVITGEIFGDEEMLIEGTVDGELDLQQNLLTVAKRGKIDARIAAKAVVVNGRVKGTINATEHISIREGAWVEADITAPRIAIDEDAYFRGRVTMQEPGSVDGEGGKPRTTAAEKADRS